VRKRGKADRSEPDYVLLRIEKKTKRVPDSPKSALDGVALEAKVMPTVCDDGRAHLIVD